VSPHVSITGLIITVSTARQESGSQHATPTCEIDTELPYVQDNDKQASIFPAYDFHTKTIVLEELCSTVVEATLRVGHQNFPRILHISVFTNFNF
jgi:hypothetical protein